MFLLLFTGKIDFFLEKKCSVGQFDSLREKQNVSTGCLLEKMRPSTVIVILVHILHIHSEQRKMSLKRF